jgi:glutamine amidotransferase
MKKVAIIDYRLGNLFSVVQACNDVGLNTELCTDKNDLFKFDGFILPGVGSFKGAMEYLNNSGISEALVTELNKGKPLFGICLGLQLLFEESEEFGTSKGLGLIAGKVRKFDGLCSQGKKLRVPNIGWNQFYMNPARSKNITPLSTLTDTDYVYFVHSFYVVPDDKEVILTYTEYEKIKYASSVQKNNIFATQFHPEKSGKKGLEIYRNWGMINNLI